MADIKLPPSMPGPRPETPPYPSYLQQFSSGATYLFARMERHVLGSVMEMELLPVIYSPWDLLMASIPADFYYTAVSTTKKFSRQNGTLIRSLLELTPRLDKYLPTQNGKWFNVRGHCLPVCIGFNDKQPLCFISAVEATNSTFRHLCIVKTLPPMIPTILVTDVDGPQPSGTYCYLDESYRAMSSGGGFLWREWRGKFSPSRSRCGDGDQTYFEGVPPSTVGGVEMGGFETGHCATRHNESEEGICRESEDQVKVTKPVPEETSKPNELEWWETEEGDDEGGNFEEESNSDLNDEEEDEYDDSDEDDSEFSGSEDGDDEYEDDSQDGDSGVNSDLEEEANSQPTHNVLLPIAGHHLSTLVTPITQPESGFPIQALAGELDVCQDIQGTQNLGGSYCGKISPQSSSPSSPYLSVADSGFESCNSSMMVPSLSPIQTTQESPLLMPFDIYALRKCEWGHCNGRCKSGSLQFPKTLWSLVASLDLELGAVRRARWGLDGVSPGVVVMTRGTPSMNGLDLSGWSHQNL